MSGSAQGATATTKAVVSDNKDTSKPLEPKPNAAQLEEDDEFEDFPVEGKHQLFTLGPNPLPSRARRDSYMYSMVGPTLTIGRLARRPGPSLTKRPGRDGISIRSDWWRGRTEWNHRWTGGYYAFVGGELG